MNKPEHALIVLQCVLICLNKAEYAWICLYIPEYSSEDVRILNVPGAVHSIRSLYKSLSSYHKTYSEHCVTFKMEHFAKRIMPECQYATRIFQHSGCFIELGHFDKHFVKNTRKKRPHTGKHFGVFSPRYS